MGRFGYGLFAAAIAVSLVCEWSEAAEVRAGVAQAQFALPERVPLAGYGRRKGKPSHGIHDPVGVRALVFEQDQTAAALVSCDLLIVDERLFEAVAGRLPAAGLPPHTVLVLAGTHTHSGPGAYGTRFFEKISMGHFDAAVFNTLVETIVRTITEAHRRAGPALLACANAPTEGLVENRMQPEGLVESALTACLLSRTEQGPPEAILVNFAAHPTTLGAWNGFLSGDYPGVVMRALERRFPGATALFFAGAVGDQAPVKAGIGFERAEWYGQALAQRTIALIAEMKPGPMPALHALQEQLPLAPARLRLGFRWTLPRWLGQRFVDDDATLSIVAAGPVVWFGVPCDLSAELGRRLQEAARARSLQPMVIGFASDYIGYCMPASVYRTKQYETLMAFNGSDTGDSIVARLTQMLDGVQ